MATSDQRDHMHAMMLWLIEHEPQIGYHTGLDARPMMTAHLYEQQLDTQFNHSPGVEVIRPDCSEMAIMVCRMSGLADPSGNGYNGYGNSNDMWKHLPHYTDPLRALVGAIPIFGQPDETVHVNFVLTPGKDPEVFNHGSEGGPNRMPLSRYLAATGQNLLGFLSIAGL